MNISLKKLRSSVIYRGALSAFIIKAISTGLTFVLQVGLARWLGVENYGIYIYALTWVNLFTLVGQGGFQNAGKKYISVYKNSDIPHLKGFIIFSYSSIVIMCITIFLCFLVFVNIFQNDISDSLLNTFYIGSLLLLFNSMTQNTMGILQGYKQIVKAFAPRNVLRLILIIIGVFFLYLIGNEEISAPITMGVNALATLIVLIVTIFFMTEYLPDSLGSIKANYKKNEWIKVTIPLFLVASLGFILNRTDVLIIGILLNTSQAGIYAVASKIGSIILFGTYSVNAIVAPVIADLYAKKDIEKLQVIIKRATRGLLIYAVPAYIIIIFFGDLFLGLFGYEFVEGQTALLVLAGANTITAFFGTVMYTMMMTNNQDSAAVIMLLVTIFNAILNIMLIPIFNILGAAISTGLSTIIWNVSFYLYIRKNLAIDSSPF